ncbi:MAG TPA: rRNA maturation RNase YbeY [Gemmatimonadaceae bacterium]|nr:rRNA maturation RNase YbeY [Gemmatimonadaceae bacterium]
MRRTLLVAVSSVGVRSPVPAGRLAATARLVLEAEGAREALLSIALVTNGRIAALNARHLKRRGTTDVLAFGLTRGPRSPIIGDIYIAPGVARVNARRAGVRVREEVVRLVVHGVLHVLGYDHPAGAARERSAMWRRQETLLVRALATRAA